jgi:hypothetical protein
MSWMFTSSAISAMVLVVKRLMTGGKRGLSWCAPTTRSRRILERADTFAGHVGGCRRRRPWCMMVQRFRLVRIEVFVELLSPRLFAECIAAGPNLLHRPTAILLFCFLLRVSLHLPTLRLVKTFMQTIQPTADDPHPRSAQLDSPGYNIRAPGRRPH